MANVIKHKRGSGSDPSASNLVVGELAIRTDTGKLFTKMDSGALAEIAGGGSDIAINTLSSSSGTGGGSATFNGSAYRFTLSSPPSVSAAQLLVSINGVIQKPVAGTGQPSEGFSVDGNDIILGDAPATGSDFFILTFRSLGVSVPADNSVTSAKIVDGTIVNADINASAAIAGSKINPVSLADVGIGVSSPNVRLHQHIGTSGTNSHRFTNTTTGTGSTDGFILGLSGDEHVLLWNYENTPFRLATNSTERVRVTESGLVGINTTSPGANLEINKGSLGTYLKVGGDNASNGRALTFTSSTGNTGSNGALHTINATSSNGAIALATGSSEALRIDSSGRLLIGATSARSIANITCITQIEGTDGSAALSITRNDNAAAASTCRLNFGRTRATSLGGVTAVTTNDILGEIRFSGSDGTDLTNHAASIGAVVDGSVSSNTVPGRLVFNTATGSDPVERMRIASDGKVGIGTTSPRTELDLSDGQLSFSHRTDYSIRFYNGNGNNWSSINNPKAADGNATNHSELEFRTATGVAMHMATDGKIGIGTTSPLQTLDVTGSNGVGIAEFTNTATSFSNDCYTLKIDSSAHTSNMSSAGAFAVDVNSGRAMTINGFGRVGIGTSSPGSKLHVANDNSFAAKFGGSGGGSNYFIEIGQLGTSSSAGFNATGTSGSMLFQIDGSEKMRIAHTTGNVGIGTTSPTDKLDVNGTAIIRSNLYLNNNVYLASNKGIYFDGNTGAANHLDDYEEGTYTPVMKFGGGNNGMSVSNMEAIYTKIGRMVFSTIRFIMNGKGSSTGQLTFEGLPYAVGNVLSTTSVQGGFDLQYLQGNVNAHEIKVYPWESTSTLKVFKRSNQNSTTSTFDDDDITGTFDGRISFFYTTA